MDLNLDKYNVRDATLRSLLGVAHELGVTKPTEEQQDKFSEIADALEARVQDALDEQAKNITPTQEEEEFVEAEEHDTFLHMEDGEVESITHKGILFGKFCNERVAYDPDEGRDTFCIKKWGHFSIEHEDMEGNTR